MNRLAIALLAVSIAGPALAQSKHRESFDPIKDLTTTVERTNAKLAQDATGVATQIEGLLDTADAIKLATTIPGLQDTVGQACWQSFDNLSQLFKQHPLPLTLKVATDIEAARLTAMALNQVCTNPNCSSMWTDAENAASALSITPMPFSLTSLCSKIPAIGTAGAAVATPVQPAAAALGTSTTTTTPAK